MSIAQQNEIDELKLRVRALEGRVSELEADAVWMKDGKPQGSQKTLTLPAKRKNAQAN